MRKINFIKIGMENFGCYIEPIELEIKNDYLTMIVGPNGAGKSTIFDSISFSLYGETTKRLRGEDVVNNKINKDCHTWLEFYIDNEFYRIDRYVKCSKFGTTVLLKRGNDTDNVIKKGHKEVLPEIEKLIMPQKLFFNTRLFGQKVNSFFTDLEDSKQKEIFRKILDLENYILYQKEISTRIENLQLTDVKYKNEIDIKNNIVEDSKFQIDLIKTKKRQFEEEKQNHIKRIEEDIKELISVLNELKNKKDKYGNDLEIKLNEINILISEKNNEIENINNECNLKISEISNRQSIKQMELNNSAKDKIRIIEREKHDNISKLKEDFRIFEKDIRKDLSKVDSTIFSLSNELTSIESEGKILSDTKEKFENSVIKTKVSKCPTCKQTIGLKEIEDLKKLIDEMGNKIKLLRSKYIEVNEKKQFSVKERNELNIKLDDEENKVEEEINSILNKYKEEEQKINFRLKEVTNKLNDIVVKEKDKINNMFMNNLQILNSSLKDELDRRSNLNELIKEKNTINDKIIEINHKIDLHDNEIKSISSEKFDESQIFHMNKRIENSQNEIKDLKQKRIDIEENIQILEFWKDGFSPRGIPSMLIDQAIPFMNKKVSIYLDKICHGRYIVSFDTLSENKSGEFRDKISVKVFDIESHANQRKQLSGGQSRIVDIATILTLSDLQSNIQGVEFNILLFDEIFDSLDDTNINQVSKLLKIISKNKSIFVISHKHIDQIEANETLNFLL